MINIGNIKLKDIYASDTKIKEVYIGSQKIWSSFNMYFTQDSFEQDESNDRLTLKIVQSEPITEDILDNLVYMVGNSTVSLGETVDEVNISDPIVNSELNEIYFKVNTSFKSRYSWKTFKVTHSNGAVASTDLRYYTNYITGIIGLPDSVLCYQRNADSDELFVPEPITIDLVCRDSSKDPDVDFQVLSTSDYDANIYYSESTNCCIMSISDIPDFGGTVRIQDKISHVIGTVCVHKGTNRITSIDLPDDIINIEAGSYVDISASIKYSPLGYNNGDDKLGSLSEYLSFSINDDDTLRIYASKASNKLSPYEEYSASMYSEQEQTPVPVSIGSIKYKIKQILYIDVSLYNSYPDYNFEIEEGSYVTIYNNDAGTKIEYLLPSSYSLVRSEFTNDVSFGQILNDAQTLLLGDINTTMQQIEVSLNLKYTDLSTGEERKYVCVTDQYYNIASLLNSKGIVYLNFDKFTVTSMSI